MHPTQQFWDERFGTPDYLYGTEPNRYFQEKLEMLIPGCLLLPAEGEGRNAVYAAKKGWQVMALDLSEMGREKAHKLAQARGVTIHYELTDLREFNPKGELWDVIGLFYAHFPPEFRAETHRRLIQALRPGGYLILEAFHPSQLGRPSGGPKSLEMLYTIEMLLDDFKGMDVVTAETASVELAEGSGHSGAAEVVRLFLQKP
ncbi:MAG TPA: SAM-dependent methyltransferase [Saprospirales bacterium]|nr:SAM-dependent methyltransferase [Saprospirales bacterium]